MTRLLPSGMVTFVLTDVEGSTRLFRRIGDRYPPLLERHRELLRAVWAAHGGHEVATEGDSFFVAFADATAAVDACAHAQRTLRDEAWPPDVVIRVRIGVHTGPASPRGNGYVAYAAHQAARVAEAAHGGQVVLSGATASRVDPPIGATMVALGRFRIRDFDEPVELFRLDVDDIEPVDTALRAMPAEHHNLLRPVTALVGRNDTLEALASLVRDQRLVSVVGTGGLGKTRLAIEYGLAHAADWPDGVWFADLSRIDDPTDIDSVVADAVGVPLEHEREAWSSVVEHLRAREAVLLFDNCEHLGDAVALRVADLLAMCPGVRVLATSREPLGLRWERVARPAPLDLEAAVELFCRLAGTTDPDTVTAAEIRDLCERVDGLPLAIELAAARADQIAPSEIVAGLDAGHGLGISPDPTLSPRQRSLEELITWSYALLTVDEQHLFRSLGVFEAGFDRETASAAAPDIGLEPPAVEHLLRSLLEKSLVVPDPVAVTTRYRLHLTVRTIARRLLDVHEGHTASAASLARHYLSSLGPQIQGNETARSIYQRRAVEIDNLRRLITSVAPADEPAALAMAIVVVDTVTLSSRCRGLAVGQALLDQLRMPCPERVALLDSTSGAASGAGDLDLADELNRQATALRARVGEPTWLDGALDEARAVSALYRSDPETALAIARAGLKLARTAHGRARLHGTIGCASVEVGDLDSAQTAFEQEEALYPEATAWRAVALSNLCDVALRRSDLRRAGDLLQGALEIAADVGHSATIVASIVAGARIAAASDDWRDAVVLAQCAIAQQARVGIELFPSDEALIAAMIAEAERLLSPAELAGLQARGLTMDLEDAIVGVHTVISRNTSTADPPSEWA